MEENNISGNKDGDDGWFTKKRFKYASQVEHRSVRNDKRPQNWLLERIRYVHVLQDEDQAKKSQKNQHIFNHFKPPGQSISEMPSRPNNNEHIAKPVQNA